MNDNNTITDEDATSSSSSSLWLVKGGRTDEQLASASRIIDDCNEERQCWICLGTCCEDNIARSEPKSQPDHEQPNHDSQLQQQRRWCMPCRCKGSARWVHAHCLERWIDEKQRGDYTVSVGCERCRTCYTLEYPASLWLCGSVEWLGRMIGVYVGPTLVLGGTIAALYWLCASTGALVLLVFADWQTDIFFIVDSRPKLYAILLPVIPFLLFASAQTWVLGNWIFGKVARIKWSREPRLEQRLQVISRLRTPFSSSLCHMVTFPVLSKVLGNWLIDHWPTISYVHGGSGMGTGWTWLCGVKGQMIRSLVGGLVILTLKTTAFVYLRYNQLAKLSARRVVDFCDVGIAASVDGRH